MLALTQAFRTQQLALRAGVLQRLLRAFRSFDPENAAASWAGIENQIVALTQAGYGLSAGQGGAYFQAVRQSRGIAGEAVTRLATPTSAADVARRLELAGPRVGASLAARGRADAFNQSFVSLSGSVGYNVLEGGRLTVLHSVDDDAQAVGWARVTGPDPCAFCAMLASRGPAYKAEGTARYTRDGRVYHPHCGCSVEPVYFPDDPWPGRAREFRELWNQTGSLNAFRRTFEASSTE